MKSWGQGRPLLPPLGGQEVGRLELIKVLGTARSLREGPQPVYFAIFSWNLWSCFVLCVALTMPE